MSKILLPLALCCLVTPAFAVQDEQQSVDELLQEAQAHLGRNDFDAAAAAFRKVVKQDADNGRAWHLLGFALHAGGNLDEAIKAHQKATEFPAVRGVALYNLGCAYSLKSQKDKAFEYLNRAVAEGFTQLSYFNDDTDLENLRDDVRFARVVKRVRGEDVTDDFTSASLVGKWIVEKEVAAGTVNKDAIGSVVTVTPKNYIVVDSSGEKPAVDYKVDTSKVVPTIRTPESVGIMSLSGDRLTIAFTAGDGDAPEALASTEQNRQMQIVLRRALTPGRLSGNWEYVSGVRAGESIDNERLVGTVTVSKKDFQMPAGPDDKFVMSYTLSTSGIMDAIDLKIESGPVPEGRAVGVIKVTGDRMTICYDPTGAKRPEGFKSTEDNGAFLFVLRRTAKKSPPVAE